MPEGLALHSQRDLSEEARGLSARDSVHPHHALPVRCHWALAEVYLHLLQVVIAVVALSVSVVHSSSVCFRTAVDLPQYTHLFLFIRPSAQYQREFTRVSCVSIFR